MWAVNPSSGAPGTRRPASAGRGNRLAVVAVPADAPVVVPAV